MSSSARIAASSASPTIPAATGTAPSARVWRARNGSPTASAELLPVPYFHVVFTVPAPIAAIALQNKAVVYDILFKAAAETIRIIAADPKASRRRDRHDRHPAHLGPDPHPSSACPLHRAGRRPRAGRTLGRLPARLLPARPCSLALYRRLFLERLQAAFDAGELKFFGDLAPLARAGRLRRISRRCAISNGSSTPSAHSAAPQQVLDYLGRYTHRVAIANGRLLDCDNGRVRFRWKDYRANNKSKAMTLDADEFMRRFLLHVCPRASAASVTSASSPTLAAPTSSRSIRAALDVPEPTPSVKPADYRERYAMLTGQRIDLCPCCGGRMVDLGPWPRPSSPPRPTPRCDTS